MLMILVTGGTGLVGSHLLLELCKTENKVRATHRPSSDLDQVRSIFSLYEADPSPLYDRIEWVIADLTDPFALNDALDGVDKVYHAAAQVSFDPADKQSLIQNNVRGTANLVNACLENRVGKLCYVSSTSTLGSPAPGELITEKQIWSGDKGKSTYAIAKFNAEMEVWRGMAEGLNAVIVNPSIIIGPGDWQRSSSYLFTAVWKGLKYYTRGITGYVDVQDVVRAMIRLMEGDFQQERFTLSAENLSYQEILNMIAASVRKKKPAREARPWMIGLAWRADWLAGKLFGKTRRITRQAVQASRQVNYFSNEKITRALDFEFKPVDQSIREVSTHFLNTLPV